MLSNLLPKTDEHEPITEGKFPETGLRFLGFFGMLDPPRPEVSSAIAACKSAGIQVVMLTGDHPVIK